MKILCRTVFLAFSILATNVALAEKVYHCTSNVPKGKSIVVVKSDQRGNVGFEVKFHNTALNEVFEGKFKGTLDKTGSILAHGAFKTEFGNIIDATIQGSLKPRVRLSIHANRDRRIEYGYGLHLDCK